MGEFFSRQPTGVAFTLFGPSHLVALALVVAVNAALFFWKNPSEAGKKRFRYTLAAVLLIDEVLVHVWNAYAGRWTIQTMLPFHLCAVLVYVSSFMLITRNYRVYEFCYFFGLAAASQALLTPDVEAYNFPHIKFITAFLSHGSIVTAAVYMTVIEGFRPTWRSFRKAWLILHGYAILILGLNFAIGSNYLFINRPPSTPSLIDLLVEYIGPWPYYLIGLEALALIFMLIVYLPFIVKDWRTARRPAVADS